MKMKTISLKVSKTAYQHLRLAAWLDGMKLGEGIEAALTAYLNRRHYHRWPEATCKGEHFSGFCASRGKAKPKRKPWPIPAKGKP